MPPRNSIYGDPAAHPLAPVHILTYSAQALLSGDKLGLEGLGTHSPGAQVTRPTQSPCLQAPGR